MTRLDEIKARLDANEVLHLAAFGRSDLAWLIEELKDSTWREAKLEKAANEWMKISDELNAKLEITAQALEEYAAMKSTITYWDHNNKMHKVDVTNAKFGIAKEALAKMRGTE